MVGARQTHREQLQPVPNDVAAVGRMQRATEHVAAFAHRVLLIERAVEDRAHGDDDPRVPHGQMLLRLAHLGRHRLVKVSQGSLLCAAALCVLCIYSS